MEDESARVHEVWVRWDTRNGYFAECVCGQRSEGYESRHLAAEQRLCLARTEAGASQ